jgi:hypothetical protein
MAFEWLEPDREKKEKAPPWKLANEMSPEYV